MIGRDNYEEWPTSEIEKTLVNIELFLQDAPKRIEANTKNFVESERIFEQIDIAIKVRERLTGILKERGEYGFRD